MRNDLHALSTSKRPFSKQGEKASLASCQWQPLNPLDGKATRSRAKGNRARTALTKVDKKKKKAEQEKADISSGCRVRRGDMTVPMCLRHPELCLYPSQISPEFI